LSAISKRRQGDLEQVLQGVAMDDAFVVQAAARGFTVSRATLEEWDKKGIDDAELRTRGWTREEFEIALEARRPNSESSVALRHAHERTGMRIRKSEERHAPAQVVNIVMPSPRVLTEDERALAPVIEVSEDR
jgi:hypothetical protein